MKTEYVVLRSARPLPKHGFGYLNLEGGVALEALGGAAVTDEEPNTLSVKTEEMTSAQAARLLQDDTTVVAAPAMPMSLIAPLADAGDDVAVQQAKLAGVSWGVQAIGADKSDVSGKDVTVAVLDTGIDPNHPAFAGVDLRRRDFTGSPTLDDENGHGTHCAGTIFGRDVDGVRIGIARGVTRAFIGKVLDARGRGSSTAVADAIDWAVRNRVNVISMSLGFDFPGMIAKLEATGLPAELAGSQALSAFRDNLRLFDSLMQYARSRGALQTASIVVAASGNQSKKNLNPLYRIETSLPAASTGVVSVGALRPAEGKLATAPFSNINPTLSAPGVAIVSARRGGGLVAMNGTSMACPHVAGAAALWWEKLKNQGQPGNAVSAKLVGTAIVTGFGPDYDPVDHGAGLVRAP